jgi:hypothetical protein
MRCVTTCAPKVEPRCTRRGVRDGAVHPCLPVSACRAPTSRAGLSKRGAGRGRRRRRAALNEVATNAVLHGSSGGQPIQVAVHVNDDWVEASVLDHGPQPRPGVSAETDTHELRAGGRGRPVLVRHQHRHRRPPSPATDTQAPQLTDHQIRRISGGGRKAGVVLVRQRNSGKPTVTVGTGRAR